MEHPKTLATSAEYAESLSPLEFDAESESFHATYDSSRNSTSLAVVAVVAAALDKEPENLKPLQSVIETAALDELAMRSPISPSTCDHISFRYHGFELTVTCDGVIEANPLENS
ncbi:HalOD1 output domain-containing protein [Haloarchaeobius salinus]|uniref:HalOD1 output domain-containing protein n=1 Tax=Haloarchaeobius salinus TaxID=1198298 RepID=UPI00210ED749|nr:HalOD1 output domain-containing protein [Haloarchaeobius salinus]